MEEEWVQKKRAELDAARVAGFRVPGLATWLKVAKLLETQPSTRDLPSKDFIEVYLSVYPEDRGRISYEAIRRRRAELQNIVAPDLYPKSGDAARRDRLLEEHWREEHTRVKQEERRNLVVVASPKIEPPLPEGVRLCYAGAGRALARTEQYLPYGEWRRLHEAMKRRGWRYSPEDRGWIRDG